MEDDRNPGQPHCSDTGDLDADADADADADDWSSTDGGDSQSGYSSAGGASGRWGPFSSPTGYYSHSVAGGGPVIGLGLGLGSGSGSGLGLPMPT